MFIAVIAIHILVSVVLIISILLQAGKGASIGATFGGASSQTLFGSAGPATFLAKITGVCAAVFMVTSIYLTVSSGKVSEESIMMDVPGVAAPAVEEGAGEPAAEAAPAAQKLVPAPIVDEPKPAEPAKAPETKPAGR